MKIPLHFQFDARDCGPAVIHMLCEYYGKYLKIETIRKICQKSISGTSLLGIKNAFTTIGFDATAYESTLEELLTNRQPLILLINKNHYVILLAESTTKLTIYDPVEGRKIIKKEYLITNWLNENLLGVFMTVIPNELFAHYTADKRSTLSYLTLFKSYLGRIDIITPVMFGLVGLAAIQYLLPFTTQIIIDEGIKLANVGLIYVLLFGHLALILGRLSLDVSRSWLMLFLSARVNSLHLKKYLKRLSELPLTFFSTKSSGDIMQRLNDHERVENFVTTSILTTIISLINFIVLSVLLYRYNVYFLVVFFVTAIMYFSFSMSFFSLRKKLDRIQFKSFVSSQNAIVEYYQGIFDIKMGDISSIMINKWYSHQEKLHESNFKFLKIRQYQQLSSLLLNEGRNLIIIYICALQVIENQMTIGQMVAIIYIISQLVVPTDQLINFFQIKQSATLSWERLNEVNEYLTEREQDTNKLNEFNIDADILVTDLNIRYENTSFKLSNINLIIPWGKTVAFVGESGSGKTTLLKLLVNYFDHYDGDIFIGKNSIRNLDSQTLRNLVGVVLPESHIFSESIVYNITLSEIYDETKLYKVLEDVCLTGFLADLPHGLETQIGDEGTGISNGQKQRILLARALYKEPSILFLDEPTSALDSLNEKIIMQNIFRTHQNKSVVIAAHRLSTIVNADIIYVFDEGKIVEFGDHDYLYSLQGKYFNMFKSQMIGTNKDNNAI
jgi:ATP-binding cassette subfamily B protein